MLTRSEQMRQFIMSGMSGFAFYARLETSPAQRSSNYVYCAGDGSLLKDIHNDGLSRAGVVQW